MTYMKVFFHSAVLGQAKVKPIAHFMCGCLDSFSLDFQFREVRERKKKKVKPMAVTSAVGP